MAKAGRYHSFTIILKYMEFIRKRTGPQRRIENNNLQSTEKDKILRTQEQKNHENIKNNRTKDEGPLNIMIRVLLRVREKDMMVLF